MVDDSQQHFQISFQALDGPAPCTIASNFQLAPPGHTRDAHPPSCRSAIASTGGRILLSLCGSLVEDGRPPTTTTTTSSTTGISSFSSSITPSLRIRGQDHGSGPSDRLDGPCGLLSPSLPAAVVDELNLEVGPHLPVPPSSSHPRTAGPDRLAPFQ